VSKPVIVKKTAAVKVYSNDKIIETATKKDSQFNSSPEKKNSTGNHSIEPRENTIYRYSDEELNEFKDLINSRLEVARKEFSYLQGQMRGKDASGIEDNSERKLSIEDGSGTMELEQVSQLASRQQLFVNNLEKALIRIENKTYGICRETGKLIDKARLRAVPHATLSMEAKRK